MFSQQMASLVGPAYVGAFGSGIVWGMTHMPEARLARTRRIMVSTYLDNVGKTATRFANNSAAAVLLYILTGKMINFVFQEEFDDFGIQNKYDNAIYGACAGALFKCTRGKRPMMLGAVLGACCGSAYGWFWRRHMRRGD